MFETLNTDSASGHRALAAMVVAVYAACVAASVMRHGDRNKTKHVMMRAVSLLRDAARSSLRADREGVDSADAYADAARARIYVAAVERLLSAEDVAQLTGISLDRMREYVDEQLARTKADLPRDESPPTLQRAAVGGRPRLGTSATSSGSQPALRKSRRPAQGWESAYAPSYLDAYANGEDGGGGVAAPAKRSPKW